MSSKVSMKGKAKKNTSSDAFAARSTAAKALSLKHRVAGQSTKKESAPTRSETGNMCPGFGSLGSTAHDPTMTRSTTNRLATSALTNLTIPGSAPYSRIRPLEVHLWHVGCR